MNWGMRLLDETQIATLKSVFQLGSAEASQALTKWLSRDTVISVESADQVPLEELSSLISFSEEPMCFCVTDMRGPVTGQLILAFDDTSGLALADMLLDQEVGLTTEWTEFATSAAMETSNIVSCSYLNALAEHTTSNNLPLSCLPSPPEFIRDFCGALLESAVMGQALVSEQVVLIQTRFEVESTPFKWMMLFVPDPESMDRLLTLLVKNPY